MSDERPVLDWHPPTDARRAGNQPFRLTAQLEALGEDWLLDRPLVTYRRRKYVFLDQGRQGACPGFGAANALALAPYRKDMDNPTAQRIYKGAQRYDQWAGESYEGSSVLGAMDYLLKESTFLRAYWWCETPDELRHAVSMRSAVEVGTAWLSGMWTPDADGVVHATGREEGGHAYCIGGIDVEHQRYRIDNSWGPTWGDRGSAWISWEDLEGLVFGQAGEAAMPRKALTGGALK